MDFAKMWDYLSKEGQKLITEVVSICATYNASRIS